MNIGIVFHYSKGLTVQCVQIRQHNVWVRVCWLVGQCEGKCRVENQPLSRAKCFDEIKKKKMVCR